MTSRRHGLARRGDTRTARSLCAQKMNAAAWDLRAPPTTAPEAVPGTGPGPSKSGCIHKNRVGEEPRLGEPLYWQEGLERGRRRLVSK